MEGPESSTGATARPWRITAIVAVALAIAFGVWLATRGSGDSKANAPTTTAATTAANPGSVIVAATLPTLRTLSHHTSHPIFWAGQRAGTTYELTQTGDGKIYIRYLPKGAKLGTRTAYPLVGTYPVPDGYAALQDEAKKPGESTFKVGSDGIAVTSDSVPTNVYLSFRGAPYEIEVFDPKPGNARQLVASGAIVRVPR